MGEEDEQKPTQREIENQRIESILKVMQSEDPKFARKLKSVAYSREKKTTFFRNKKEIHRPLSGDEARKVWYGLVNDNSSSVPNPPIKEKTDVIESDPGFIAGNRKIGYGTFRITDNLFFVVTFGENDPTLPFGRRTTDLSGGCLTSNPDKYIEEKSLKELMVKAHKSADLV
ncbi:hypothetical protein A2382_02220 [Candidatus Woesebacteria bacterium RIFOXYB1_FULL_38_16]|uniref:Uncharacterized protein n=1 Tax=Candidatus Woesebacteria bacterium RIFOXYB1_FULL_38_16 TaxID=1802538 RepID=A0A1F8CTV1_9BACT|nr:MAG: hypothetical protein A2191_04110 [Candidatus Woesebacteria bacterium RIFOXYA1_FULL_38_9]OGM79712.1 MAG: hypothetical protein A2382_02220 [Candidatus Woesebacteria bacterium RIFOXYB1_FULL_38_16]